MQSRSIGKYWYHLNLQCKNYQKTQSRNCTNLYCNISVPKTWTYFLSLDKNQKSLTERQSRYLESIFEMEVAYLLINLDPSLKTKIMKFKPITWVLKKNISNFSGTIISNTNVFKIPQLPNTLHSESIAISADRFKTKQGLEI